MLKSSLYDYSDAYILVNETVTVENTETEDADVNKTNKKVIFKKCVPFTNYTNGKKPTSRQCKKPECCNVDV